MKNCRLASIWSCVFRLPISFSLQDQIPIYFQAKFFVYDDFKILKDTIEVDETCIQGPEKNWQTDVKGSQLSIIVEAVLVSNIHTPPVKIVITDR